MVEFSSFIVKMVSSLTTLVYHCVAHSYFFLSVKITPFFVLNLLLIGLGEDAKVLGTASDEKPMPLSYNKSKFSTARGVGLPKVDKTHNVYLINFKKARNPNAKGT